MSHTPLPASDLPAAHRHFAAACFNRAWEWIEKPDRTPEEAEAMVLCATASLWHWTQRDDRTDLTLSIGHWQVSRACALAGLGESAMRHAERSLALAAGAPPFYAAYAHEAAARAAAVLHDAPRAASHLRRARALAAQVPDPDDRRPLDRDLDGLNIPA